MEKPISETNEAPRTDRREYQRQYRARKLAEDPEGYRRHRGILNKQSAERIKQADPEAYRNRYRAAIAKHQAKLRELDPAKLNAHARAQYQKVKRENPEKILIKYRRQRIRRDGGLKRATTKQIMLDVKAALAANLPRDIRDEVTAAVIVEIIEGRLRVRDAKTGAKQQYAAYNRTYDQFKNLSLDAADPTTGLAWINNLASDVDHF